MSIFLFAYLLVSLYRLFFLVKCQVSFCGYGIEQSWSKCRNGQELGRLKAVGWLFSAAK